MNGNNIILKNFYFKIGRMMHSFAEIILIRVVCFKISFYKNNSEFLQNNQVRSNVNLTILPSCVVRGEILL